MGYWTLFVLIIGLFVANSASNANGTVFLTTEVNNLVIVVVEGENLIRDMFEGEHVSIMWDSPVNSAWLTIDNCNIELEVKISSSQSTVFENMTVSRSSLRLTSAEQTFMIKETLTVTDSTVFSNQLQNYITSIAKLHNSTFNNFHALLSSIYAQECSFEKKLDIRNADHLHFFSVNIETDLSKIEADEVELEGNVVKFAGEFMSTSIVIRDMIAETMNIGIDMMCNVSITNVNVLGNMFLRSGSNNVKSVKLFKVSNSVLNALYVSELVIDELLFDDMHLFERNAVVTLTNSHIIELMVMNSVFDHFYIHWGISVQSSIRDMCISNVKYRDIQLDNVNAPLYPIGVQEYEITNVEYWNVTSSTTYKKEKLGIKGSVTNVTYFESDIIMPIVAFQLNNVSFRHSVFTHPIEINLIDTIFIHNCTGNAVIQSIFKHADMRVFNIEIIDFNINVPIFQSIRVLGNTQFSFTNVTVINSVFKQFCITSEYLRGTKVGLSNVKLINTVFEHLFVSSSDELHNVKLKNFSMFGSSSTGVFLLKPFILSNTEVELFKIKIQHSEFSYFLFSSKIHSLEIVDCNFQLQGKAVGFIISSNIDVYMSIANVEVNMTNNALFSIFNGDKYLIIDITDSLFIATNGSNVNLMIYNTHSIMRSYQNVTIVGDRIIGNGGSNNGFRVKGYVNKFGINTISESYFELVFGYSTETKVLIVTYNPFSWDIFEIDKFAVYPMETNDILNDDLWVTVFHDSGATFFNSLPPIVCRMGFGWDPDKNECIPCRPGYQQLEIESSNDCHLDTKLDHLSFTELDAITGSMYNVPYGHFIVQVNNSVTLIDCMNSFCTGGQVMPGLSGLSLNGFNGADDRYDIYQLNNITVTDYNGCAVGHQGLGCTKCIGFVDFDDISYFGFSTISYGCLLFPIKHIHLVVLVFYIHCALLFLILKNWNLLSKIRWTIFLPKETIVTDFDTFRVLSTVKDFVLVIYPLIFASDSQSLFLQNDFSIIFATKLFFNPFAVFSIILSNLLPIIDIAYYILFVLFFFVPKKMCSFVELLGCIFLFEVLIMDKFLGVFFRVLAASLAILAWYFYYSRKAMLLMLVVYLVLILQPLSAFFSVVFVFLLFRKRSKVGKKEIVFFRNNLISFNFFVLPSMAKLTLINYLPFYTPDLYGLMERKWHSLTYDEGYELYYAAFLIPLLLMFVWCYLQIREINVSEFDYRKFLFVILIGRSFYVFVSYICHDNVPNLIFLIALMTYIAFAKPFYKLNALITRVLVVLILANLMIEVWNNFSFVTFAATCVPSTYVFIQALISSIKNKEQDKDNSFHNFEQLKIDLL
ncbi:hypothetical protein PCE1_004047 [Barthelona sp. PCE]